MQLAWKFQQPEMDAEQRRRQEAQIARALDGTSVPVALFLGVLCAVPAALLGVLLIIIRT